MATTAQLDHWANLIGYRSLQDFVDRDQEAHDLCFPGDDGIKRCSPTGMSALIRVRMLEMGVTPPKDMDQFLVKQNVLPSALATVGWVAFFGLLGKKLLFSKATKAVGDKIKGE